MVHFCSKLQIKNNSSLSRRTKSHFNLKTIICS